MKNRTSLIPVAIGIVLTADTLCLVLTCQTRFGRHLPMYPASTLPGIFPRMARALRSHMR
jgi:hypothetical protein